jgi:glycosyltransferase involved in cell wall biosynthesis
VFYLPLRKFLGRSRRFKGPSATPKTQEREFSMRVLFLVPRTPWPLDNGANQRSFALLRALCAKHDVTLATPLSGKEEQLQQALNGQSCKIHPLPFRLTPTQDIPTAGKRLENVASFCSDFCQSRIPYRYRSRESGTTPVFEDIGGRFDAAFCRYGLTLRLLSPKDWPRAVLDADDLTNRLLWQEASRHRFRGHGVLAAVEALRTYRYEQRMFRRVAHTLACSDADLARIGCERKSVLRNGVDLPNANFMDMQPDAFTVVFVGAFTYKPNVEGLRWFIEQVWPEVRAMVPEARLNIVGRQGTPETLPFADAPGVNLVGPVESTSKWFASAILSLVPLWMGSGTRIKIIESLAYGRPVVATELGAEGLEQLTASQGLFRVANASNMAKKIAELMLAPNRALELGRKARALVEREFSWTATTATLADDLGQWISKPCC